MTTTYKGFTIDFSANGADSRQYVTPAVRGFNTDGYASVSSAKSAITKWLKAEGRDVYVAGPIVVNLEGTGAAALPVKQSRNKREGYFDGITNGEAKLRSAFKFKFLCSISCRPRNRKQRKAIAIRVKNLESKVPA